MNAKKSPFLSESFAENIEVVQAMVDSREYAKAEEFLGAWTKEDLAPEKRAVLDLYYGLVFMNTGRSKMAKEALFRAVQASRLAQDPPRSSSRAIESVDLSEKNLPCLDTEAAALGNLGNLYSRGQSYDDVLRAEDCLMTSLEIYQLLGSIQGQANQLFVLGQVEAFLGRTDVAVDMLERASMFFEKLGDGFGSASAQEALKKIKSGTPAF